ncbi:TetR/AcrR family transcriptional regulator [Micromonospora polyrhachis]
MSPIDGPEPYKRRREVTVERLLDAALSTFAELGFQAARVEDICSRGGFTRGAFYSSFRTKDELLAALFEREMTARMAQLEEQLTGVEEEDDPVAAAVERGLATYRQDRAWAIVYLEYALYASRHPEAVAALRRHMRRVLDRLTSLIENVVRRTGVTLTIPAAQLARIVIGMMDGLALQEISTEGNGEVAGLHRPALLLMLRAVTSAPPAPPAPLAPSAPPAPLAPPAPPNAEGLS